MSEQERLDRAARTCLMPPEFVRMRGLQAVWTASRQLTADIKGCVTRGGQTPSTSRARCWILRQTMMPSLAQRHLRFLAASMAACSWRRPSIFAVCLSWMAPTALLPTGAQAGTFHWPTLPRSMATREMLAAASPMATSRSAQAMASYFRGSTGPEEPERDAQPAVAANAKTRTVRAEARMIAFIDPD